ncbi:MAG: aminotransferase class V-fold PLP-dependent enzyme [Pseudomonadota bacterium]
MMGAALPAPVVMAAGVTRTPSSATPSPSASPLLTPWSAAAALAWRRCFPALGDARVHHTTVFADNSSRSQMPAQALTAVAGQLQHWETHRGGQPGWDSPRAERAAALRQRARAVAASLCGGQASQIGFAANGTSALAILSRALVGSVLHPGDTVVITEADHDANRTPWQALSALGIGVIDVPVATDGALEPGAWGQALARRPKVVALCMLSNVTGVLLPFQRLAQEAQAAGAVVVLDAVQGPPHGHTDIMWPEVDVAIFSNCKLFSPHLGWWAVRESLLERMKLRPAQGAHPSLEWGSFGHASFAGFVATFEHLCALTPQGTLDSGMAALRQHEAVLLRTFLQCLPTRCQPLLLAGETAQARAPIFSLALAPHRWAPTRQAFERAGIDVRIGQFGTPATLRRLAPATQATALRLSFVHYNSVEDVQAACAVLDELSWAAP